MKAIVCGGRDYTDIDQLYETLNQCRKWWKLTTIITGGAKGADQLGHIWAKENKLNTMVCHADWNTHGRSAGMIRNRYMLEQDPDVVIAFKGGDGTENMITISRRAGVPVFII